MSIQKTTQGSEVKDARIKELTEENELLFEQLHLLQEELEKYYHKLKDCEQRQGRVAVADDSFVVIPPQINEALAENLKLHALVKQQQAALQIESTNSLAARLGEMLINGVSSVRAFLTLPFRLCRLWKAINQTISPAVLGGKNFQKVLDAQATGGMEAVETLLDSVFLSSVMRANAYTALARHVMLTNASLAAKLARMAWETDPRPYRLKWLAFRLYEVGDFINAEALLDMLPANISMSNSEERKAYHLRQESRRVRSKQVKQVIEAAATERTVPQAYISTHLNKLKEEHNKELTHLSNLLTEYKKTAEMSQQEATQVRKTQETQKHQMEVLKNKYDALVVQNEEHKQEIIHLNRQLIEYKKVAELAQHDVTQALEAQETQKHQMEAQKRECDNLSFQTALMLKNMLTHFEPDSTVLSQVMRIIMGSSIKK